MPTLKLVKLTTTSFQGINSESPVIIDFTQFAQKKIVKLSGDMGVGKTSAIHSLLYACGQSFDFKLENFVNINDGALSGSFEFQSDKKNYRVKYSKTKFLLERLFKDADEPDSPGKWIQESDPKTLLKTLIGHIATSPMFLKEVKGEKQVEWLYSVLNIPKEVQEKEATLKAKLKADTAARTAAGNLYKQIHSALEQDEMYSQWESSEQAYAEEKNIESVREKFDEADRERNRYSLAVSKVERIQADIESCDKDIAESQKQVDDLLLKIQMLQNIRTSKEDELSKGNEFLEQKKDVHEKYNNAIAEFKEINTYVLNRNNWLAVKQKKKDMDEAQNLMIHLDVKKDDGRNQLKALIKGVLPDIKGLEVETEDHIDGSKAVGIYIDGKTPAQLSESELMDFYFQVCISQGVNMAFVENLTSFGSKTIATINKLAKKGIYFFGTMMDRRQKTLKIEVLDEIE